MANETVSKDAMTLSEAQPLAIGADVSRGQRMPCNVQLFEGTLHARAAELADIRSDSEQHE